MKFDKKIRKMTIVTAVILLVFNVVFCTVMAAFFKPMTNDVVQEQMTGSNTAYAIMHLYFNVGLICQFLVNFAIVFPLLKTLMRLANSEKKEN